MGFALLALALLPLTVSADREVDRIDVPAFPSQLQGTWHPVPHECGASGDAGNDMRFDVSAHQRMNYGDVETVIQMVELPGSPRTWRLTTTSNVVGDETGQSRIYVLGQKFLFVTDGDRMDQYMQCR